MPPVLRGLFEVLHGMAGLFTLPGDLLALVSSNWTTALFLSPLLWMAYDLTVNGLPGRAQRQVRESLAPLGPKNKADRFQALARRIQRTRDMWHSDRAGAGVLFISEIVSLTPHLEALEIPCPPEPAIVDETHEWEDFLSRLLPLAELGRLEDARHLLRSRT